MSGPELLKIIRDLAVGQEKAFSEAKHIVASNNSDIMRKFAERDARVGKMFAEQAERIAKLEIAISKLSSSQAVGGFPPDCCIRLRLQERPPQEGDARRRTKE